MAMYNDIIRDTLHVNANRASLVEAYLRLQYGTLDALSRVDIRREYSTNGISDAIDADVEGAIRLAKSYGCFVAFPNYETRKQLREATLKVGRESA